MSSTTNHRASLLAGLRTGGVRSASGPAIVPHTAAPAGSFNVPRLPPFSNQPMYDDEEDHLAEMVNHNLHLNANKRMMQPPVTASAADGVGNKFQQQQQAMLLRQMAAQRAAMNAMPMAQMNGMMMDPQLQMQLMQMEIMKLQALQAQQAQQYQVDLLAQAQRQQQRAARRVSGYGEPATADPSQLSFDLRSRSNLQDTFTYDDGHVPMTAAIGGKFGSRNIQSGLNPNANVFTLRGDTSDDFEAPKAAAATGRTTVISGGAALGSNTIQPSKSDSALSWRRGGLGTATGANGLPPTKVSPPTEDGRTSMLKTRPQPLRFAGALPGNLGVSVETQEFEDGNDSDSSFTSDSVRMASQQSHADAGSSPTTPPSASSTDSLPTRDDAAKKPYEGLGMGRPAASQSAVNIVIPSKQLGQPLRQPRGPPASVDELGNRNFASRIPRVIVAQA